MIWKYLDQHDADELIELTIAKLDQAQTIINAINEPIVRMQTVLAKTKDALAAFQRVWGGDELAKRFPTPDQRGRPRDDAVWQAARDVGLIRKIWKDHKEYLDRKFKRSKTSTGNITVTAEQIAADRWHVDVEAVYNRLKKPKATN
jgi:uncharacterized coiled-coil protein SlyX